MFVDASAMVALMVVEPEAKALAERLEASAVRYTSALAIFETALALVRIRGYGVSEAEMEIGEFLEAAAIKLTPIGPAESKGALMAHETYGKGRHPAGLNMGDCFAYACAKTVGVPLLYKGEDFAKTDLAG